MGEIKERKQLTYINLKDGRTLVSESKPVEIYNWIDTHSHIMIDGEMHSKYDIVNAVQVNVDCVESMILTQTKEFQVKIREKKKRLKSNGKEMTISYLKNYINILNSTQK